MSDNIKKVYQAFLKAGFSEKQAKALTAEVGRENAYQSKYIFGHHTDMANSADNLGFFSWQGERKKNLLNKLQQKGLYSNGRISESQESLNTMAEFAKEEMENIGSYKKTKEGFLKNPNISQAEAAELLGRNYLRWDMDGKYIKNVGEHKKRRDKFYSQISGEPYTEQQYTESSQTTPQEQPQAGYVGMLPNGLPEVYGQPYVVEEETKTETVEAPKRTENANKLGFVADYEELSKQYEQQLQAQQNPIIQQEIVEGVQYQPIQQNFQEGGYFFQKGGTWEKQQARRKAEKDAKLKALLAQEKPVYKKKTVDEKLAEKRAQENTKTVQKDNTNVRGYNNAEKFSKTARNKTDKEVAEERQTRMDAQAKANEQPFDWSNFRQSLADRSQATGDALRVSNEPNFFDDYLNPAVMIGSMADNLGQAPLRAQQEDSYMPYVTAVGTPLTVGAMAGIGTQNTGQFVNNLANPLAGTGDLVNNLGNKYLPNAYKLNPKAFKLNEENLYRQIGESGYIDAIESNVIRSADSKAYPNPYFAEAKDFDKLGSTGSGATGSRPNFIAEMPMGKNGKPLAYPDGRGFWVASESQVPLSDVSLYKKDWLKGYKQVEVPKTAQDFKSEIDWSKWNKEIPDNPQLMKEYNAIEQTSKANNTWMKNPDGSAFQGTPEQFVQQNSENFKKAFGNTKIIDEQGNPMILHHGHFTNKDFSSFLPSKRSGISNSGYEGDYSFFTPHKSLAEDYAGIGMVDDIPGYKSRVKSVYINSENPLLDSRTEFADMNIPKSLREGSDAIMASLDPKQFSEVAVPYGNNVKSATGNNGMFDMSNPNIYKAAVPIGLGASYLGTQEQEAPKYQLGGIKIDPQGYWNPNNEGKPVIIPSPSISMKNVNYPIYGKSLETGEVKLMTPNNEYFFANTQNVLETPIYEKK
jgi:hypothetical protein